MRMLPSPILSTRAKDAMRGEDRSKLLRDHVRWGQPLVADGIVIRLSVFPEMGSRPNRYIKESAEEPKNTLKVTSSPETAIIVQKTSSAWQTMGSLSYLIKNIYGIDF
jgi:hypothetical protein